MDGRRFDAWTRLLARGLPRRRAVKAIAGAGLAGIATRAVIHEAEACLEDGQFCTDDNECCEFCIGFSCGPCVPKGGHGCANDNDCCGGKAECKNGVCKKPPKRTSRRRRKKKGGGHAA